jgi:hypothetical protein
VDKALYDFGFVVHAASTEPRNLAAFIEKFVHDVGMRGAQVYPKK